MTESQQPRHYNRRYKDTVFRDIFGSEERKEHPLSLYNALNHTDYQDPDELTLNMLDNVIYLGMYNDVSFIIEEELNVWEHQSTHNPNMPLRVLKYVARLYENHVEKNEIDEYGSKLIALPTPKAVVFYIGERERPEVEEMYLSDSFSGMGDIEVRVVSYNINQGNNQELMEKCEALRGYSHMVARERAHEAEGMPPDEAIVAAIDDCIRNGILKGYFEERKATVADIFMTEYDEREVIRRAELAAFRKGQADGYDKGQASMVSSLMRSQGMGADDAMGVLGVPEADRPRIRELLA